MTTLREAALMALEALDCIYSPLHVREIDKVGNAISALRSALEQLDHTEQPIEMVATCKECLPVEPMAFAYYWPPTNTLRRNPTYQLECGPTTAWKDEIPLYTAPPQREWQGLTDEEINEWDWEFHDLVFEIEAKLKEKNT